MAKPKVKLKFHQKAFDELRQSPAAAALVLEKAQAVVEAIEAKHPTVKGYEAKQQTLRKRRAGASIRAYGHAYRHNRRNQTILRNLGAARD